MNRHNSHNFAKLFWFVGFLVDYYRFGLSVLMTVLLMTYELLLMTHESRRQMSELGLLLPVVVQYPETLLSQGHENPNTLSQAAKRTLEITSQHSRRTDDPTLSRNYGTNDRMLRCKRVKEHFFMDAFFATKKAGKSTRQNTCCQLFVTDKGFAYVVPMKSKSEVLQAVKQFAKEVGAPDAIICDMSGEQTSKSLRKFCHEIGTTLKVLEEGTPWANKAELYVGLIKEAVRKDMKDSNCPLAFWDYCVERRARINNLTAKNIFKLQGTNAHTALTGEEGDISSLSQFGYDGR